MVALSSAVSDDFNVSIAFTERVFASVLKELIRNFLFDYVKMPRTDKEWREKAIGFIESYGFPCVVAWDGFHMYVGAKLKDFNSSKRRILFQIWSL